MTPEERLNLTGAPDGIRRARPLLGTFVEIAVAGATIDVMEAAIEQAFAAVAAVHRLMSFHQTDSDVSRLNRGAASASVRVDDWTYQVLETACDLNRRSEGVFDVCVAPALQRLGLLPDTPPPASPAPRLSSSCAIARESGCKTLTDLILRSAALAGASRRMAASSTLPATILRDGRSRGRPPQDEVRILRTRESAQSGIREAAEYWIPAFAGMTLEDRQPRYRLHPVETRNRGAHDTIQLLPDNHVRFADPAVKIDLGGIAKGFAVDRAVEALRHHGVADGLVNAGGDLRTLGSRIYEVDIRDPRRPERPMCRAALCNAALASSAGRFDPARSRDVAGFSIIDPASAMPVKAIRGATVRAPSCIIADALTKVVMNIGEAAASILEHYRADALFVSAQGDVHMTANWKDEVRLAA